MHRLALRIMRDMRLHLLPDFIADRDAIAIKVHRERRDDMGLGAEPDRRGKRLTGKHMRPVKLSVDHPIEQNLPVGLRFKSDEKPFILEIPFLIGHSERRHIGQLDKAEFQLVLLDIKHPRKSRLAQRRGRGQGKNS